MSKKTATSSSPSVSFNQWLSLQRKGPFAPLAEAWQVTRGRLTRATVVERAGKAGIAAGDAGRAYDTYCETVGLPIEAAAA